MKKEKLLGKAHIMRAFNALDDSQLHAEKILNSRRNPLLLYSGDYDQEL